MPFREVEDGTTPRIIWPSSCYRRAPGTTSRDPGRAAHPDERSLPADPLFSQYKEIGSERPLPRTEAVAERILTLPLYAHMRDDQVELVTSSVLEALALEPSPPSREENGLLLPSCAVEDWAIPCGKGSPSPHLS